MRKTGLYLLLLVWHIFQNCVKMARYKRLSKNLKKLRKEKQLTQEELAERANLDPKTIIDIEGGRRANPTLQTLNKLARALKVNLERLLFS